MRQTAKYSITKCFLVSKMSRVMRAIIIYLRKIKHKLAHSVHHGMFGVGVINYLLRGNAGQGNKFDFSL